MAWINADGLMVPAPKETTLGTQGGSGRLIDNDNIVEFELDLTSLTASQQIVANGVAGGTTGNPFIIPKGALISKVDITTLIAATGGTSIDIGLIRLDRATVSPFGDNVLATAVTTSVMDTVNEVRSLSGGISGAGSLITSSTGTTVPGYVTANFNTSVNTAGKIRVQIFYRLT